MSDLDNTCWFTESMIPKAIIFILTIILLIILASISFKKGKTIGEGLGQDLTQIVEENNYEDD